MSTLKLIVILLVPFVSYSQLKHYNTLSDFMREKKVSYFVESWKLDSTTYLLVTMENKNVVSNYFWYLQEKKGEGVEITKLDMKYDSRNKLFFKSPEGIYRIQAKCSGSKTDIYADKLVDSAFVKDKTPLFSAPAKNGYHGWVEQFFLDDDFFYVCTADQGKSGAMSYTKFKRSDLSFVETHATTFKNSGTRSISFLLKDDAVLCYSQYQEGDKTTLHVLSGRDGKTIEGKVSINVKAKHQSVNMSPCSNGDYQFIIWSEMPDENLKQTVAIMDYEHVSISETDSRQIGLDELYALYPESGKRKSLRGEGYDFMEGIQDSTGEYMIFQKTFYIHAGQNTPSYTQYSDLIITKLENGKIAWTTCIRRGPFVWNLSAKARIEDGHLHIQYADYAYFFDESGNYKNNYEPTASDRKSFSEAKQRYIPMCEVVIDSSSGSVLRHAKELPDFKKK